MLIVHRRSFAYRAALMLALLSVGLMPIRAEAQTRDSLLVSVGWLAEHLQDPDLVVLHLGPADEYAKQHIPGARHVALADVSLRSNNGLTLEMMSAEELRQKLASFGVSDTSRIVVYPSVVGVLSQVTRVMFTLDRAGLGARSSVLDGGLAAWVSAGRPVTTEAPGPREGRLSPLTIRPIVVDGDFVQARLDRAGFRVVDGRLPAFYGGEQTGGSAEARHKTGHIANAGSLPYTSIVDAQGLLKPRAELETLFAQAGVKAGDTVVAYCHIGQQATAVLFAARSLGIPVLLYDGSFEDWSRRPNAPVEVIKKEQ